MRGPLPPYLERESYEQIRDRAHRITMRNIAYSDQLRALPSAHLDRYILLDAQDWMNDATLAELWTEITRTARPGARVIFRTAGEETISPVASQMRSSTAGPTKRRRQRPGPRGIAPQSMAASISISSRATGHDGDTPLRCERMDRHYRYQRFIYDLTRTHYLIGRKHLIGDLASGPGETVLEIGCGTAEISSGSRNAILIRTFMASMSPTPCSTLPALRSSGTDSQVASA